nr:HAD family hydrolase [Candidatus Njordarchaeota archaeon]
MFAAIIFDLGDTLVRFPWDVRSVGKEGGMEMSLFDKLVKVTYDSLVKSGIEVDWPSFHEKYMSVRAEQLEWQKKTLHEYDMDDRVSRTLSALGLKISPDSATVKKATDDHYASYTNYIEMEREVPKILQDLRSKRKLGLITNFAHPPSIYKILSKFDLRKFFDVIVVSREVGWVKPSPKIFKAALSSLKMRSSQCVFVGDDAEADIKGAKGVGMKTIFISKKGSTCQEADATIRHITELKSTIQKLET